MTESEEALVAALSAIARLPGATVTVEPDATWLAGGRPLEGLNHVLRAELAGDDAAIEARIDELDAALRAARLRADDVVAGAVDDAGRPRAAARRRAGSPRPTRSTAWSSICGLARELGATSAGSAPAAAGDVAEVGDAAGWTTFWR